VRNSCKIIVFKILETSEGDSTGP